MPEEGLYSALYNLSDTINTCLRPDISKLRNTMQELKDSNFELSKNILKLEQAINDIQSITTSISNNTTIEAIKLLMANQPDQAQIKEYMKVIRMIYEQETRKYSISTQKEPIPTQNFNASVR
jgi:succinate dehydrogenase/fumarate reductase flavoprotein subunit